MFCDLREQIKNCYNTSCKIPNKNSPQLHFDCLTPEDVKILIISEQPKETENIGRWEITEKSIKKCLRKEINASPTINKIAEIMAPAFKESIINDNGPYYWTHHTKCPSASTRSSEKECPKNWLEQEINSFPNLKCVISIGKKAYQAIMTLANIDSEFTDLLWEEFEIVILRKPVNSVKQINLGKKQVFYIALPHVSTTPLQAFNKRLRPLIKNMEEFILN